MTDSNDILNMINGNVTPDEDMIDNNTSKNLDELNHHVKIIENTLKKYKYESNIPINHQYWESKNEIRRLSNE